MATIGYIDGYNFYYGAVRGTGLKWADLVAICNRVAAVSTDHVHYFTARIKSEPGDPGKAQRQDVYLRALVAHGGLSIQYGKFQRHAKRRDIAPDRDGNFLFPEPLVGPMPPPTKARVWRSEEKGSDVNLATQLVSDAYEGRVQTAVVVSNDSDLRAPLQKAVELGIDVRIINPHEQQAKDIRRINGVMIFPLHRGTVLRCQLPDPVVDSVSGQSIHRPPEWY